MRATRSLAAGPPGFRTFAISGLLGGVVGALAHAAGGAATAGGGAVIGIGLPLSRR